MSRPLFRARLLAALVALAALVVATAPSAQAQTSPAARIHLLHGIPGVTVDVYSGDDAVIENFEFGATNDLSALAGQTVSDLQVRVSGSGDVAIDAGDVQLPASGNHTVIAHLDAEGQPALAVFTNNTSPTAAGQGRVTVRHAAAAPAVDVLAGGQPAFTNLASGQEGSADLPAGTVSASVVPTGASEPVVLGPTDLAIEDGTALIVYAVGSLENQTMNVLTERITGLSTAPTAVNTGNSPVEETTGVWWLWVALAGVSLATAGLFGVRLAIVRAR
jgi:hypothetical protein